MIITGMIDTLLKQQFLFFFLVKLGIVAKLKWDKLLCFQVNLFHNMLFFAIL